MPASHLRTELFEGIYTIELSCRECKEPQSFNVTKNAYERWLNGVNIQTAMPLVPAHERELLVSGVCNTCWNELFPPEEEE